MMVNWDRWWFCFHLCAVSKTIIKLISRWSKILWQCIYSPCEIVFIQKWLILFILFFDDERVIWRGNSWTTFNLELLLSRKHIIQLSQLWFMSTCEDADGSKILELATAKAQFIPSQGLSLAHSKSFSFTSTFLFRSWSRVTLLLDASAKYPVWAMAVDCIRGLAVVAGIAEIEEADWRSPSACCCSFVLLSVRWWLLNQRVRQSRLFYWFSRRTLPSST